MKKVSNRNHLLRKSSQRTRSKRRSNIPLLKEVAIKLHQEVKIVITAATAVAVAVAKAMELKAMMSTMRRIVIRMMMKDLTLWLRNPVVKILTGPS